MIDAFVAFFVLGSFGFYVLAASVFLGVLFFSEHENNIISAILVALFVWIMESNGSFSLFHNPWELARWVLLYFAVGAGWSVVKWFSFVNKRGDEFAELKIKWLKRYNDRTADEYKLPVANSTDIPATELQNFVKFLKDMDYIDYKYKDIVPDWKNCKEKITTWILWWPTSAIWTIINDPLVRFARWIYKKLGGVYEAVSRIAFKKFGNMSQFNNVND